MTKRRKILMAGAGLVAIGAGGAGVAIGTSGEEPGDSDVAIQGASLEKASAAALDHTGGGTVTGTETGDEESYYEVEVTLDDGSQVDVQLDRGFEVVSSEDDGIGEDEGAGDD